MLSFHGIESELTMPFGSFKGERIIDVMTVDWYYCWKLTGRDWFKKGYNDHFKVMDKCLRRRHKLSKEGCVL